MTPLRHHLRSLGKATLVSVVATLVEFAVLALLLYVWPVPRTAAFAGVQLLANLITFTLYKWWVFEAGLVGRTGVQYARQSVIFGVSWVLNTVLPTLLYNRLHLEPVLAFALSTIVVYIAWNYPGNRFWVFKETLPSSRTETSNRR